MHIMLAVCIQCHSDCCCYALIKWHKDKNCAGLFFCFFWKCMGTKTALLCFWYFDREVGGFPVILDYFCPSRALKCTDSTFASSVRSN